MFWRKCKAALIEARRREIQTLENDARVFEDISKIYAAEASALERLSEDEISVLSKLEREGPDAAMELFDGILHSYSPHLRAEWCEE